MLPARVLARSLKILLAALCFFAGDALAENIAVGTVTPKDSVAGWMNSPGHRRNILLPELTQAGVAFTTRTRDGSKMAGANYWVMVCARPRRD